MHGIFWAVCRSAKNAPSLGRRPTRSTPLDPRTSDEMGTNSQVRKRWCEAKGLQNTSSALVQHPQLHFMGIKDDTISSFLKHRSWSSTHDTQIIEGLEKEKVDGKRLLEAHYARKRADRAKLLGLNILIRHSWYYFFESLQLTTFAFRNKYGSRSKYHWSVAFYAGPSGKYCLFFLRCGTNLNVISL
jgi:hypothetical protein